jgi:hypothetical protein
MGEHIKSGGRNYKVKDDTEQDRSSFFFQDTNPSYILRRFYAVADTVMVAGGFKKKNPFCILRIP